MTESIAHQFIDAIGPAFKEDDLARILGSGDGLVVASASSHSRVTSAAETVRSMIHRTHPPQGVIGIATLLEAPRNDLPGAVRTSMELLHQAYPSDIDWVAGGLATHETAASEVTVSIWVRTR
jgi:hypothetical protein